MNNSVTRIQTISPALSSNSISATKTSGGGENPYFSSISQILLKSNFSGSLKESKSILTPSDGTGFSFSSSEPTFFSKRPNLKVQTHPSSPCLPKPSNDQEHQAKPPLQKMPN